MWCGCAPVGVVCVTVCPPRAPWLQLADGLHLIDFEQLKIENLTLNEKIEERSEELHKLSKKTTQTVQVLTHVKEKLQFVQAEAQVPLPAVWSLPCRLLRR